MDFFEWVKVQWDRVLSVCLVLGGLVALWLGYLGVSASTLPTQQIPYLASGGLLGLFLLGAAGTLWLSADLRDEWRKLDEIHRALKEKPAEREPPPTAVQMAETRGASVARPTGRARRVAKHS